MDASLYLSSRGCSTYGTEEYLLSYLKQCNQDAYNPSTNPNGIIDIGAAINRLSNDILVERFSRNDGLKLSTSDHLHAMPTSGLPKLKEAVASFLNRYLKPNLVVLPDDLFICNGTIAALDMLAYSLFDPGDVVIIPAPTYGRTPGTFRERSLVKPYIWYLSEEPDEKGVRFYPNAAELESIIKKLQARGENVRGVALITPNNPLGNFYDQETLKDLLDIGHKYDLHMIVDQLYAFSSLESVTNPPNVLAIKDIPDPERTHFIWGLSKDFCSIGLRVGVLHTRCTPLQKVLATLSFYQTVPVLVQEACANILNDTEWLEKTFFPINQGRLKDSYEFTVDKLKELGLSFAPPKAGFFIWVDLGEILREKSIRGEMELFEEFLKAKVYVSAGKFYFSKSPGWFRMTFTQNRSVLEEGLRRFTAVVMSRKLELGLLKK